MTGIDAVAVQSIELFELIDAHAISTGNLPQGIAAFDDVNGARSLAQPQLLSDENAVARNVVEATQCLEFDAIAGGNFGERFSRLDYVDGFVELGGAQSQFLSGFNGVVFELVKAS